MKKVVFYTHKTSLIQNWVHPLSEFANWEIYVFHINSLDNERLIADSRIKVIDVAALSTRKIVKTIECLAPSAVIFLGFRSLLELLLLRICKRLHVQTIYLEHGLYTKDTSRLNSNQVIRKPRLVLKKYLNFISKYFGFIWMFTNRMTEIKVLYHSFFLKKYQSAKFDKALFFSEYGFQKLNDLFHYSKSDVVFCGYPLFKSNNDIIEAENSSLLKANGTVLYVHQPFILNKQTTISYIEELNFITEIWNLLKGKYEKFCILLHPREDVELYKKAYSERGIEVIQRPNDYNVFIDKSLVIGHYSTALLYPLFFKKKTIIIDYPDVEIDYLFLDYCLYCRNTEEILNDIQIYDTVVKNSKSLNFLIGTENNYQSISEKINMLL